MKIRIDFRLVHIIMTIYNVRNNLRFCKHIRVANNKTFRTLKIQYLMCSKLYDTGRCNCNDIFLSVYLFIFYRHYIVLETNKIKQHPVRK